MAHEIGASNALDNAIFCSFVVPHWLVPLLTDKLRCLFFKAILTGGIAANRVFIGKIF